MDAVIRSWGNSHGIRIPHKIMKELNIQPNSLLDMHVVNDSIIISKKHKHKSLEESVHESGIPLKSYNEYDWGNPLGDEVW